GGVDDGGADDGGVDDGDGGVDDGGGGVDDGHGPGGIVQYGRGLDWRGEPHHRQQCIERYGRRGRVGGDRLASVPADGFGGVVGGAQGPPVVVTSLEAFVEAAAGDEPKVIQISGTLSGYAEISSSNKTIEGLEGSEWHGGLALYGTAEAPLRNVIVRNLRII